MQKPNSVFFSRKTGHDFLPMESTAELEKMCKKYDASQFAFGSHNKKRPNNVVLGQLYTLELLEHIIFSKYLECCCEDMYTNTNFICCL